MLPEQLPERYWFVAQLLREHAEHCVLTVEEQLFEAYLPPPQVEHVEHPYPLLLPEHDPVRYLPLAQAALAQVLHRYPLLLLEHDPVRYWPPGQLALEHEEHCVLAVEEQLRDWYRPLPHEEQEEHRVLEADEQLLLAYWPPPHVEHE